MTNFIVRIKCGQPQKWPDKKEKVDILTSCWTHTFIVTSKSVIVTSQVWLVLPVRILMTTVISVLSVI